MLKLSCYITDLEVEQLQQNIVIVLKMKIIYKCIIRYTIFVYTKLNTKSKYFFIYNKKLNSCVLTYFSLFI